MRGKLPRAVVVTGAASGIGRATVAAILEEGSRCLAVDNRVDGLNELPRHRDLRAVPCDITREPDLDEVIKCYEREVGPLSGLVHCAGILTLGGVLDEGSTIQLAEALRVNTLGSWSVARCLSRRFAQRKGGAIVLVSSNAGSTPRVDMGAYCASKAAVTMLTKCFALELASSRVRCNVVSPGSTDTAMLRRMLGDADLNAVVAGDPERFKMGIPLGRVAAPKDIVEAVLFLLSSAARHVTGWDLRVDGGATWA